MAPEEVWMECLKVQDNNCSVNAKLIEFMIKQKVRYIALGFDGPYFQLTSRTVLPRNTKEISKLCKGQSEEFKKSVTEQCAKRQLVVTKCEQLPSFEPVHYANEQSE